MKNTSKWLIAALSVSLMVNVFAAGQFFSKTMRRGEPMDQGVQLSRTLPRGALAAMPNEARQAFRQELFDARKDLGSTREEARAARRAVAKAMARDGSLDETAIAQNFERLRTLTASQQEAFERALIAALNVMTPEERRAFAQSLRNRSGKKTSETPNTDAAPKATYSD